MGKLLTGKKSPEQLRAMRDGGKILATIFREIRDYVHAGLSELDVDAFTARRITHYGAEPTYTEPSVDFPGVICISTNSAVVHGVPTGYVFKRGDVVSFDMVIRYRGMCVDAGFAMVIDDTPSGDVQRLLEFTERALYAGIDAVQGEGTRVGDISAAVEAVLRAGKLGIVRELVGHGVGFEMHLPPDVPNYGRAGTGPLLHIGDTIAIEPITTLGSERIMQLDDGWTIATKDGSLSAYAEHTILITESGAEILTK